MTGYEGWAVLELMGHRQRVGRVQEVEMFGGKLLQIDIPVNEGYVTEFYGTPAIYALRPVAEDVARDLAKHLGDPRPVRPVGYRRLTHEPTHHDGNETDGCQVDGDGIPF